MSSGSTTDEAKKFAEALNNEREANGGFDGFDAQQKEEGGYEFVINWENGTSLPITASQSGEFSINAEMKGEEYEFSISDEDVQALEEAESSLEEDIEASIEESNQELAEEIANGEV